MIDGNDLFNAVTGQSQDPLGPLRAALSELAASPGFMSSEEEDLVVGVQRNLDLDMPVQLRHQQMVAQVLKNVRERKHIASRSRE